MDEFRKNEDILK